MGYRHRSIAPLPVALLLVVVISVAYLPRMGYAGTSDLTVDSIWLEDASQPGQPISQVSSGQSFLIVATIKNIGQETASGYYVDVYYDNDYGRGGPDNILPGEVQTWYVGPLTAQDGTHTIKWVVDPDNQIAELNEGNNLKEYSFTAGQQITTTSTTNATTTAATTTVETTQLLTSTGTTNVTSHTTTTVTSYTGTTTSTSTIVVPTTVTVGPSAMTATLQTTQVLTTTGTTQVISYTTTTLTSYTSTTTSTGTVVVYTTVVKSVVGAGVASSPLTYLGFLSLLALAGGRVMALNRGMFPISRSWRRRRCSNN